MSLTGTHVYNVDRKGRVVLPAPFRRVLGEPVIISRAPEGLLAVLSMPQWDALAARFEDNREFRALYLASATECPLDATTGRVLIPASLREWAGIRMGSEVALAGLGRMVFAGRRDRWEAWQAESGDLGPFAETLDTDLCGVYSQTVSRPLGLPVIRCRGRLHGRAVQRLVLTLSKALAARPPAVLLDVRLAGERERALPLLEVLTGPARTAAGVPLWLVTEEATGCGLPWFPTLEAAFLALPEARPC